MCQFKTKATHQFDLAHLFFDFFGKKTHFKIMQMFARVLIFTAYIAGTILGVSANSAGTERFIRITHSHAISDPGHGHEHDDRSHDHDAESAEHVNAKNQIPTADGKSDQSVPHSHCISIGGSAAYCLRFVTVTILPVQHLPVTPSPLEDQAPDDPVRGSIFRPPIA